MSTPRRETAAAGREDHSPAGVVWRAHPLGDDTARLAAPLMAALVALVGAQLALAGGSVQGVAALVLLALGAAASALVPRHRLSAGAVALPSWWACAALALACTAPAGGYPSVGFALVFLYAGLTVSVRGVTLLGVGAVALASTAAVLGDEVAGLPEVALAVAVGVVVGGVVAQLVARHRKVRHELRALLTAVTALGESVDAAAAAQVVVDLAVELLEADGAQLLLTEATGSTSLLLAASSEPVDAAAATVDRTDSAAQLTLALRRPVFVPDAPAHPMLRSDLAGLPTARAVLLAPLPGEGDHLGVLQVWWRQPHRLDSLAEQAVELLTRHSGQVLERLRSMHRLAAQASTDPLTGMANRREFLLALSLLRPGGSVVFLDLDHFKALNDSQGHAAGDQVLQQFAAVLMACVREEDCAARYGGEEFALVLPSASTEAARQVVTRISQRWAAEATGITFSAGLCEHAPGQLAAATLGAADSALYEAKRTGRDRLVVAGEGSPDAAPPRGALRALPAPRRAEESARTGGPAPSPA